MKRPPSPKLGHASREFPIARDVAERAGVSTATVSRVLNGTGATSHKLREAVLKAAEELGFVANGAAKALSSRRFMTVGAIVPNIQNEAFVRAVSSFQDRLRRDGYTMLLTSTGYDLDAEEREANFLLERGIDGLMLVGDLHRPSLLKRIERAQMPLIQTFSLSEQRPCVGFDNREAGFRAASYLLDLGHTRFGVISGDRRDNDRGAYRVQGAAAALAKRHLAIRPEHDLQVAQSIAAGRDALRQIMNTTGRKPTAIICGTDQLAFGVMIEAQARGMAIPEDLSIVGFNDADYAAFLRPALTTIRVHASEIGRVAGEQLIAGMQGRTAVRATEIAAELIVRGSTAPPASGP